MFSSTGSFKCHNSWGSTRPEGRSQELLLGPPDMGSGGLSSLVPPAASQTAGARRGLGLGPRPSEGQWNSKRPRFLHEFFETPSRVRKHVHVCVMYLYVYACMCVLQEHAWALHDGVWLVSRG